MNFVIFERHFFVQFASLPITERKYLNRIEMLKISNMMPNKCKCLRF